LVSPELGVTGLFGMLEIDVLCAGVCVRVTGLSSLIASMDGAATGVLELVRRLPGCAHAAYGAFSAGAEDGEAVRGGVEDAGRPIALGGALMPRECSSCEEGLDCGRRSSAMAWAIRRRLPN